LKLHDAEAAGRTETRTVGGHVRLMRAIRIAVQAGRQNPPGLRRRPR